MTCPARARVVVVLTTAVRLNVSGLSRVGRCCGQAMMRSARFVLRYWFVQEHAFLPRAYDALIDCFVITPSSLAFCRPLPLLCDGRVVSFVERSRSRQDHPGDPGDLVCERDRDLVSMHSFLQGIEPAAELVARPIEMRHA